MIRQVLHPIHLYVVAHAVHLSPRVVINVDILALRCREHGLVVQERHVPHCLLDLDLARNLPHNPVAHRQMPQLPPQQQMPPIPRITRRIRPQVIQPQRKDLLSAPNIDGVAQRGLREARSLLHALRLEEPSFGGEEDLGLGGLEGGVLGELLGALELHAQLLVLDRLHVVALPALVLLRFLHDLPLRLLLPLLLLLLHLPL
mmetsp:Transcript_49646/g.121201  ORF Transcript_49646/g.121201 Transcript_49646/m.121201 type:complete len:202 (-) Transcript_49646:11-616(-)